MSDETLLEVKVFRGFVCRVNGRRYAAGDIYRGTKGRIARLSSGKRPFVSSPVASVTDAEESDEKE